MAERQTRYGTLAEAQADGWMRPAEAARMADAKARDTSGYNSFGYSFAVERDGQTVAQSHTIWFTEERNKMGGLGCFREMIHREDLGK